MVSHQDIAPLFRKRPYRSPGTGFAWGWREDDELDIEYHVRHSALPDPNRVRELLAMGGRLHGSLLDRQRPLWEFHLIEGLEGNRFATYTKVHHSVVDGVSALRILERWLSPDPQATVPPFWTTRPKRERPQSDNSTDPLELLVGTARGAVDVLGVAPALVRSLRKAMSDELAGFPFKSPPTMLNTHITGARRIAGQTWSLSRVKAVARASDATLNDIVLAMCSGALRRYLIEMNGLPDSALTSMVPVSLRTDDSAGGNAVGAVITSLATDIADPSWRLARIKESMAIAKESMSSLSPVQQLALSAANMAPMPLMSAIGGGEGLRPPFNIIISNVPGPRETLYMNGARLQGVYPMAIPYHGQALNITLASYEDNIEFGLTGCRRRVPHLQRLLGHLETSLAELEVAVGLSSTKAKAPAKKAPAKKPAAKPAVAKPAVAKPAVAKPVSK